MKNLIENLKYLIHAWNCRNFTLCARYFIAKSLGISQLVYTISNLNISKADTQAVNSAIFKFIWKKIKKKSNQT